MKAVVMSLLFFSRLTWATGPQELPTIGTHYEIFRFEKSENPQNILVVYTRLDERCQFKLDSESPARPVFDFYWLMGKKTYKPVHPLIRSGVSDRLKVMIPPSFPRTRDFFSVQVKDLNQVDPNLKDAQVRVTAGKTGNSCQVKATFDMEPAGQKPYAMGLNKIYAESKKTFYPPFRKVILLRFDGVNEKTGRSEQMLFQKGK